MTRLRLGFRSGKQGCGGVDRRIRRSRHETDNESCSSIAGVGAGSPDQDGCVPVAPPVGEKRRLPPFSTDLNGCSDRRHMASRLNADLR